jgi:hypothetical protein
MVEAGKGESPERGRWGRGEPPATAEKVHSERAGMEVAVGAVSRPVNEWGRVQTAR